MMANGSLDEISWLQWPVRRDIELAGYGDIHPEIVYLGGHLESQ
jgi:hypothetical protein